MLKAKFVHGLCTFGLVGASVLMLSQPVWANPISDELLTRYHQVMNTDAEIKNGMEQGLQMPLKFNMMARFKQAYPNMTAEQQAKLQVLIDELTVDTTKDILADETLNQRVRQNADQVIQKHFNAEEIQALIDFYQTPMGQGIVKKQSLLLNDLVKSTPDTLMPIMPELMKKYDPRQNAEKKQRFEQFQKEVVTLLGEPEKKKSSEKPIQSNKKKKR